MSELGPATMRSNSVCSFVNDRVTIDFGIGRRDIEPLKASYLDFDLDKQQVYIYRPSEIFKKSSESIATKRSSASKNLQCSYELYDKCDDSDKGCLRVSDSFACKFDPKKVKDGLRKSVENNMLSLYSSRMSKEDFHYGFDAQKQPGTICVNTTTYEMFDQPRITFWHKTPLSYKYEDITLPVYDYILWIAIASVGLLVLGGCSLCYDESPIVPILIIICLFSNGLDVTTIFIKEAGIGVWWVIFLLIVFFLPVMTYSLIKFLMYASKKEDTFAVFYPLIFSKIFYIFVRTAHLYTRPSNVYFAIGSVMNDLVIYKSNDYVLFYVTMALNIVVLFISLSIAFDENKISSIPKATFAASLGVLYFFLCWVIEVSFLNRNPKFLDVFYKDFMTIIYSRLNEFLIMLYVFGRPLWKALGKHYHFYKLNFLTRRE